jgi:hypothetical protein
MIPSSIVIDIKVWILFLVGEHKTDIFETKVKKPCGPPLALFFWRFFGQLVISIKPDVFSIST